MTIEGFGDELGCSITEGDDDVITILIEIAIWRWSAGVRRGWAYFDVN